MTQIWTFHCGVNSSWDLTFSDQIEATSRWDPTHDALRPTCFSVLTLVLSIHKSMFRTRWKRKTNGGICGCDTLRFVPLQKQYFNVCFRHVYTDFLYLYYVVFVYALGLVLGCHYFILEFKHTDLPARNHPAREWLFIVCFFHPNWIWHQSAVTTARTQLFRSSQFMHHQWKHWHAKTFPLFSLTAPVFPSFLCSWLQIW